MPASIILLHHVNVTITPELETKTKNFYANILGLPEVPKPEESRGRGGAWYQLGPVQLHLSIEKGVDNENAKRHFCLLVSDLDECRQRFQRAGVEIFPDDQPIKGWLRFYVRDPGGNRIEVAEDAS